VFRPPRKAKSSQGSNKKAAKKLFWSMYVCMYLLLYFCKIQLFVCDS
jgi:hypothetical protein